MKIIFMIGLKVYNFGLSDIMHEEINLDATQDGQFHGFFKEPLLSFAISDLR